jgi:hypothetical protein
LNKDPHPKLKAVHFNANVSTQHMLAFLYYRIGDLVYISNTETGVDLYHWIQNIRWRITPGGVIDFWWGLKEHYSLKKGLSAVAVKYSSTGGSSPGANNDVAFSPSPFVDNIAPLTVSYWIYEIAVLWGSTISKCLRDLSDDVVAGYYVYSDVTGDVHLYAAFSTTLGHWETTGTPLAGLTDQWNKIAVSYDHSSAANNPLIFVNGVSYAVTETVTPIGTYVSDEGIALHVGHIPSESGLYSIYGDVLYKDARLYSKLITEAEDLLLYQNENDYDYFTTDLIFQGFAVKTSKIDDYVGETLEANMKVRDNIYGLVGTPHYNSAVTGAEMEGESIYYPNILTAGKYDDADLGYKDVVNHLAHAGAYLNTKTEIDGATPQRCTGEFTGSSMTVGFVCPGDTTDLEIIIDGVSTVIDTEFLPEFSEWDSGDLGAGRHIFTIQCSDSANYIALDFIEIT